MSDYLDPENGAEAATPSPKLCIVLLTYMRTNLALRTIEGVCENLEYPRNLRTWYIADDGSEARHMRLLIGDLEAKGEAIIGYHNEKFVPGTPFCGVGWNTALEKGHQQSDYILWLEDDWHLERPLNIRPYIRLLKERTDVGIVRMGTLAVGSDVHTVGYNGIHYLKYLRSTQYAYSGNPLLRHVRFAEYYGKFAIDRTPGEIELAYDDKFRTMPDGPDIWRPVDIGGWGIWGHIGQERTW